MDKQNDSVSKTRASQHGPGSGTLANIDLSELAFEPRHFRTDRNVVIEREDLLTIVVGCVLGPH